MIAIWQPRLPRWAICSTSKLPDKDERHLTGAFFMLSLCAVNARSQHFADHIMQDPPVFKVRQFIAGINSAARIDDPVCPSAKVMYTGTIWPGFNVCMPLTLMVSSPVSLSVLRVTP